jgi:hypothetical protein
MVAFTASLRGVQIHQPIERLPSPGARIGRLTGRIYHWGYDVMMRMGAMVDLVLVELNA